MYFIGTVCVVLTALSIAAATTATPDCIVADFTYDFFALRLQWRPTHCIYKTCADLGKTSFVIDSLRPMNTDGSTPCFCTNQIYFPDKMSNLKSELMHQWPAENTVANDLQWQHAYERYGVCVTDRFSSQEGYFQAALDQLTAVDVREALRTKDLAPSNCNFYTIGDIQSAIAAYTGSRPQLICSEGNHLFYVTVCLDKNSLAPIDCPAALADQCQTSRGVYFPECSSRANLRSYFSQACHPELS